VGGIIQESRAALSRYTRATSSESAADCGFLTRYPEITDAPVAYQGLRLIRAGTLDSHDMISSRLSDCRAPPAQLILRVHKLGLLLESFQGQHRLDPSFPQRRIFAKNVRPQFPNTTNGD
jgi:hypothetical protein